MYYRVLIGCALLVSMSSCGIFKEKKSPARPETTERKEPPVPEEEVEPEEKIEEKKDTVLVPPEEKTIEAEIDRVLNISVFFPFGTYDPASQTVEQGAPAVESKSSDSLAQASFSREDKAVISFYLGFKLGLEELLRQGMDLEVDVINTSQWSGGSSAFLNDRDISSGDVWIGGYDIEQLEILSRESAARSSLFISPFLTTSYFLESNPYYFQMKPSFKMHCRAIARDVRMRYDPRQATVVLTEDKINRSRYFRDSLEHDTSAQFRELTFPSHKEIEEWEVENYIQSGDTAVFILPVYRDKGFVYTFLSHLSLYVPEESTVIIYGVPPWDRLEILYEFFDRFVVRMSSAHYEHSPNPFRLRSFVEQYTNRYGTLPIEESWEGYDLAMFLGSSFRQHGLPLSEQLGSLHMEGLSMTFDPILEKGEKTSFFDFDRRPKYYENAGVYILEFQEDAFQLITQ